MEHTNQNLNNPPVGQNCLNFVMFVSSVYFLCFYYCQMELTMVKIIIALSVNNYFKKDVSCVINYYYSTFASRICVYFFND